MNVNQRIDDEVEKTLRSLDGIERADPQPFFLTRVQARLDRRQSLAAVRTSWLFRPAYLAASLGVVLLINVGAVFYVHDRLMQHEQTQAEATLSTEWQVESTVLDW